MVLYINLITPYIPRIGSSSVGLCVVGRRKTKNMVGKRSLPTPLIGKPKSGANNRKKSTSSYGGRGGGGGNGDLESGTGYETYHDEVNANGNNNARPRPKILDGKAPKPGIWRFRDAARTALEDERREDLKNKLLTHINHDELERFRKSDEELKEMKKKEVRKFYEAQNERLNDWVSAFFFLLLFVCDKRGRWND